MTDEDRAALMVSSRSATHADPETLETHDAGRGDVYKCETCFLLTELDRVTAQEEETAKAFEVLMHDMAEERDAAIARAEKAEIERDVTTAADMTGGVFMALLKHKAEQERDAAIARAEKTEHEGDMLALEVGRERSRAEKAEADLKAYLADTAVTCAYCEARHERPVTFEDIQAHVTVCPKHPLTTALAQVKLLRGALDEVRPHCEQCGVPATRLFRTEGDGNYWLCGSTEPDHGEEFYSGEEVPMPKLAALAATEEKP